MFTKICDVVAHGGFIVGIIISIVIGCSIPDFAFIIIFGGIVVNLTLFSGVGMIVEMATNIKKSRELLETMSRDSVQSKNVSSAVQTSVVSNGEASLLETNGALVDWKCSTCGCINSYMRKYCDNCDTPKS